MKNIIIVGSGGMGREVEWLIKRINAAGFNTYNFVGYADDTKIKGTKIGSSQVICNVEELSKYEDEIDVIIAVANPKDRKTIVEKLIKNDNIRFPNLIDPSVIYDENEVILGRGNIICAGTILTVNINIKDFNIINLDCTIGHDVILNDYITIYPNVNISGNVNIENNCEIGTGSQIIQKLRICENVIIGASACVVKNIDDSGTYVGVPAKKMIKDN